MNLSRFLFWALLLLAGAGISPALVRVVCSGESQFHLQKTPAEWAQSLMEGVEREDVGAARLAALALQSYGRLNPDVVHILEQALSKQAGVSGSPTERWPAAEVLVGQGPEGIPALVRGLAPRFERMTEAVTALGTRIVFPLRGTMTSLAVRLPAASAIPLIEILEDGDASHGERAAAATILASMHAVLPDRILLALLHVVGDEGQPTPVRAFCEAAVLYAGHAYRLCRVAAASQDRAVRIASLYLAGRVGGPLDPYLVADKLEPLISSTDAHVRVSAAALLLRAHCRMDQCKTILIDALDAEDRLLVCRAAFGLGYAGASAAAAVPKLRALEERMERIEVLVALERIGAAMGE